MRCPFKIDREGKLSGLSPWEKIKNKEIIISVNGVPIGVVEHFDIQPQMIPINGRPISKGYQI